MEKNQKNTYDLACEEANSPDKMQAYWEGKAREVSWFEFPKTILDASKPEFARWYVDGKINITYNMFDRFMPEHADKAAVIWVSNMVNQQVTYTLREAYQNVCRMCHYFKQRGVQRGDRVIIYMPMIPEALFSSWACARMGAVHSIVFGGFAAKELSGRIYDAAPKLIVTASCGLQPNKKVNYVQILEEAISMSKYANQVLIYQRPDLEIKCSEDWVSFNLKDLPFADFQCQKMNSNDYLYILYTSGTTGTPKGIVRDHGGTTVALEWTMKHIMGINLKDTYFASSDIGWVVGHSFTVYGPLLRGASTIIYEGKPTIPDGGALWAIVEKYKVNGLYTSPTGLRAIRKVDPEGECVKKYDISSLHNISMAGERCDIPTYQWIQEKTGVLINDNYWQTECGWIISCNYRNLHTFPTKAGSAIKPAPGFRVEIISKENEKMPIGELGKVCIKLPMPPSFMQTLYNNDEAFLEKYMRETPGYYTTGDAGYYDADGYLNVTTRLDDIINTAGHRLSTSQMEEVLIANEHVSEAAVVAKIDPLRGEIPVGFVVLKGHKPVENIEKMLKDLIRKEIGPVAFFQHVIIVDLLPKTRSGKILRNILRKIIEGQEYKFPATIEDASALDIVKQKVKNYGQGFGEPAKLEYRADVDLSAGQKFDEWYHEDEKQVNCNEAEDEQKKKAKV